MARKTLKKKSKPSTRQRLKAARKGKAARLTPAKAQRKADVEAAPGELPQWPDHKAPA